MLVFITCIAIFMSKVVEVSIQSIKTVCMVKSERILAACLGFVECMIWGLVISSVISELSSSPFLLLAYGLGYSCGMYLGSRIEGKLALGTSSLQIMVGPDNIEKVEEYLQKHNNGYTVLNGRGAKSEMFVIIVVLPRKSVQETISALNKLCDKKLFITTSEISKHAGGYGVSK